MNPGRVFSTPQENGGVQNGDPRIPFSQQKPVLPLPDLVPAEMQRNQIEMTGWPDLLGMYGDFLLMPASETGVVQNSVTSVGWDKGSTGHWSDVVVRNRSSEIDTYSCGNIPDQSKPACTRVNSLEELIGMKNQSNRISTHGRSSNSTRSDIPILRNSYAQVDRRHEQTQLKAAGQTVLNQSQLFKSPNQMVDCYNRHLPLGEFTLMLVLQKHNHL